MTKPSIQGISRHYVTMAERQIHYRRAGSGTPLVLVHRLPRSSHDYIPLIKSLMTNFTVIAPDLAGYGNSSPLEDTPDNPDPYCIDLKNFLSALGLKKVLLYGEQAGAAIALNFASLFPDMTVALSASALDIPSSKNQKETKVKPLPEFEPAWDGSHLTWLWSMLKEQSSFHPWHSPSLETRVNADMPSPEVIQSWLIQFLNAGIQGNGYEIGYNAVRNFAFQKAVESIQCPFIIIPRRKIKGSDPWQNINIQNKLLVKEASFEFEPVENKAIDFLKKHSIETNVPDPPAVKPIRGKLYYDYVSVDGGQIHYQTNTDARTRPLLIQHDAASSLHTVEAITRSFTNSKTVFAFDMPGSGDSDRIIPEHDVEVFEYATVLSQALTNLGIDTVDFYGMWGGGFVGLDLAGETKTIVGKLAMSNLFHHTGQEREEMIENYTPDISPVWHGGHLMQCWHQMRDQGIYYPWFKKIRNNIIWREPYLDAKMVHGRVCSLVKAGNMYATAYKAHFRYPTLEKLSKVKVPTMLATCEWDPNNPHTKKLANETGHRIIDNMSEDLSEWGQSLQPFLDE